MANNISHNTIRDQSMKWAGAFNHSLITRHSYLLAIVIFVAIAILRIALYVCPFDIDNLFALSIGARPNPLTLFTGGLAPGLPAYRPIPYLTIWLQYQFLGLRTEFYFLFNLLIWIGCALVAYAIVYILTKSRLSAIIIALAMLLDWRAHASLRWIGERQSTMAVLFGSLVLLLFFKPGRDRWRYLTWIGIFLLLLASVLSKEFGLAFSGTLVVWALFMRSNDWRMATVVAIAVAVTYFAMRLLLGGGAAVALDLCDDMGFFRAHRVICYSRLGTSDRVQQHLYNVGATFLGTLFPELFDWCGVLQSPSLVLQNTPSLKKVLTIDIPLLLMAFVGWVKMPRRTLPMLALIGFNAVLSFALYRTRNHLVGALGLYITAGIGLAYLLSLIHYSRIKRPLMMGCVVVIISCGLKARATYFEQYLLHYKNQAASIDPCESNPEIVNRDIVRQIKIKYRLSNPDCKVLSSE